MSDLDVLPPERLSAAKAALARVFPEVETTGFERMAGGSALGVFRFVAGGASYVLRLDAPADELRDTHRQVACARIASMGKVTPELVWADPEDRVSIQHYVTPVNAPWAGRLAETARRLRRLHELPLFPAFRPYRQAMAELNFSLTGLEILPVGVRSQLAALSRTVLDAYPWDDDLVSSHNDVNPSNVVFDGERSWLIDWETAFAADRYVDVASLANWLAPDESAAHAVLAAYLDGSPTVAQQARFFLMRQINRLFYGSILIVASTWADPNLRVDEAQWNQAPGLDALRPEMGTLAVHGGRVRFGLAFLKDAVAGLTGPAFPEAAARARA